MEENNKIETYYLDDDGNLVEPEKATKGVIRELDKDGNLIRETWGTFESEPEISDEELDEYVLSLFESHNRTK